MSRKTYTSSEVKDRWNREHYDQLLIRVTTGGKAAVQQLAETRGMSVAAYIRHLIIQDAGKAGFGGISTLIGGGELTEEAARRAIQPQGKSRPSIGIKLTPNCV
jgi:hypothetical protein